MRAGCCLSVAIENVGGFGGGHGRGQEETHGSGLEVLMLSFVRVVSMDVSIREGWDKEMQNGFRGGETEKRPGYL